MGRLDITKKNTEALVTFINVSKSFGATNALIDCNIEFQKGEIHSLVGENGAGKSSIIDAITFSLFGAHTRKNNKSFARLKKNSTEKTK